MGRELYHIKEIYYTIQGEGGQTGKPAVFCRFSGCNLWSGREEDRANAICNFCDTNFWGTDGERGGKYALPSLINILNELWPSNSHNKWVVFTGGEPALQLDQRLVDACHAEDFSVAIETNGTLILPERIDWVCVSPKSQTEIVVRQGQELKLVYPQANVDPQLFLDWSFERFFLQPMEGSNWEETTKATIDYVKAHPQWRLSLQTHKWVGIK